MLKQYHTTSKRLAKAERGPKEPEKRGREWAVEYGRYIDGHICGVREATVMAATAKEALDAACSLSDELEAKENAEYPDHETTYLIEELYEAKEE